MYFVKQTLKDQQTEEYKCINNQNAISNGKI